MDKSKINEMEKLFTKRFEDAGTPDCKVKAAIELAEYLRAHGNTLKALCYAEKALEIAKQVNIPHLIAPVYKELGLVFYYKLQMDKALEYSLKSLKMFQVLNDTENTASLFNDIGVYYSSMEMHEKSLEYYYKGLELSPNDTKIWNNIGDKYSHLGQPRKALDSFLTVLKIIKANPQESVYPTTLINIGNAHKSMGNIHKAKISYEKGLLSSRELNNEREMFFALLGLGSISVMQNRLEEGEQHLMAALEIAKARQSQEMLWFSYQYVTELYEKKEDWKLLSKYLRQSLEIREKMYSRNVFRKIAELETAYDIEKKELEAKKLIEKNARLASIGVMAAGITHEINQPLNAIVINTDGLLYKNNRDNILPDDYKNSVQQVLRAAQRIDKIIKHMRSFWITPGYKPYQPIKVNDTLLSALQLIGSQMSSHGIKLKKELCSGAPRVLGNQVNLEQIIINLATNSIHSLDRVKSSSKLIELKTILRENNIVIIFKDNGSGLAHEIGDKLYDPFYSTKKPGEGMGLGLAIVKQFITEMKGSISHYPGNPGALFEIVLPLYEEDKK